MIDRDEINRVRRIQRALKETPRAQARIFDITASVVVLDEGAYLLIDDGVNVDICEWSGPIDGIDNELSHIVWDEIQALPKWERTLMLLNAGYVDPEDIDCDGGQCMVVELRFKDKNEYSVIEDEFGNPGVYSSEDADSIIENLEKIRDRNYGELALPQYFKIPV